MSIHFVTFADGNDNLRAAALRITMQAAETGWFTSWRAYHAEDLYRLSPQWSASHKTFIQSNPRGFGYWIWKPLIIAETLKTIPPGDILVYLDAGYEISIQGGARFNEYIELTKEYDLLAFEIKEPIYKWTKGDILSYFGIQGRKEILTANQAQAGLVIVKNTTSNILFMNIWTECATARNYSLVDDQPSVFPNIDGFSENRHDQAIFTILLKLFRKAFTLPAEDDFPELFQKGQYIPALPFHAFRNKSGVRLIRLDTPDVLHQEALALPANLLHAAPAGAPGKLLLCRPQGGINDILCSIERCWSYAEKTSRTLYIDARYSGIRDDFWTYFRPADEAGPAGETLDYARFDQLDVVPAGLRGRVGAFHVDYSHGKFGFVDTVSDELVTFDPELDYAAPLLVHEQGWLGGVLTSPLMLAKLRLTDAARRDILRRLAPLPANYVGVHIRHTDYTSNYRAFVDAIKPQLSGRNVLICSDNLEVIAHVTRELTASTVFRLSTFDIRDGQRLHYRDLGAGQYAGNIETLSDLFALGLCDELLFGNVNEAGRPSGFSLLAQSLKAQPTLVRALLAD